MATKIYTKTQNEGDTFTGATFYGSGNYTLVGATAKMQFRKDKKDGVLLQTWDLNAGLTVLNDLDIALDQQLFTLPAGVYYSDLEITLANGLKETPVSIVWNVQQTVTQ